MRKFGLSFLLLAGLFISVLAAEEKPYTPTVAPASKEAETSLKKMRIPKGFESSIFAAEPLLANPVAFCFDEKGRCYVAETFRLHKGVTDNRGHMYWLDDELACRTVEDRVAMYRKHLRDKFKTYETEHDRVRLIVDTDGDSKADKATVFADGFKNAADGIGSGVLARKGDVFFTCIPDLWRLRDTKGDGVADVRESLSKGYGVHVAFLGHDLHGLRIGPDGKLYFSCGDRGLNVKTKEGKHLFFPDMGAVLRCDLDGSNLEVVAHGLRNPQELAFDDHGNLFTVDNNSDSGDQARLVYVVEGGDSGWRMSYQYGSNLHDEKSKWGNRGPWNYEKLWLPRHDGQPVYHLAPLANFTAGPSGLTHYPGIGLPKEYDGHFFICDFRGDAGGSGVHAFTVKPKGASFELDKPRQFVWSTLATDCDFGPDGAFYVSDWVQGWGLTGKGRIYRVTDPESMKNPKVAEAKKLLAEGFDQRPNDELVILLAHPHQQVRQEAQFALAAKGKESIAPLAKVAKDSKDRLARLHALWGLGQIGVKEATAFDGALAVLEDADAEVRAQAANILGGAKARPIMFALGKRTRDDESRVRFFAAQSLGKVAASQDETFQALARVDLEKILRADGSNDEYLRHAAVVALSRLPLVIREVDLSADTTPAVRMGLLLALRRQKNKEAARFLNDTDPRIVAEAARAIHDQPIDEAMPDLAALLDGSPTSERQLQKILQAAKPFDPTIKPTDPIPALHRALDANFRLGQEKNAKVVAAFAARTDVPDMLRRESLKMLADWSTPSGRDRVQTLWRPLKPRETKIAEEAFRAVLGKVFTGSDAVRQEASRVAVKLGIKEVGPLLLNILHNKEERSNVRVEALLALDGLRDQRVSEAIDLSLADADPALRRRARQVLAKRDAIKALPLLTKALEEDEATPSTFTAEQKKRATLESRQSALAILATLKATEAQTLMTMWLDRLVSGQVAPELQLDVLSAAKTLDAAPAKAQLAKYEAARSPSDHLAKFRETLEGGNAEAGQRLFVNRAELSCVRCHKIKGEGGEVGPELTGIAGKQKREYLLESLVDPSKQIAKGFETVVITTTQGKSLSGILKAEDKESLTLMTPEAKLIKVEKKDIEDRQTGKSAMPDDLLKHITLFELRDLVEYLGSLK